MFEAHTPSQAACGATTITPQLALILSSVANAGDIRLLVAQHDLYQRDGEVRLGSGEVIGPERVAEIVRQLDASAARQTPEAVLPPHVIAQGADMVAWHTPGHRRPMFFSVSEHGQFVLHVAWPPLMCVARGSRVWMAALDSDARPCEDTPLFHAPIMNQTAMDGMCSGSIQMPARATVENIPAFEQAVFETNFSHVNGGNHLRYRWLARADERITNDNHIAFWRGVEARRLKRFPSRHLLSLDVTVGQFIRATGANR